MNMNWILDEYDGIIYISDLETYDLKYMNNVACRMCNTTKEEIAQGSLKCYKLLQGQDSPCPFCTNSCLCEDTFYEWEHYNEHLNRTFLLKDRKLTWDDRDARIEFAMDITIYRDRIASKERERDSVLKSIPGGIARVDARDMRTILWYGANFLSMIGYTKEQFEKELHLQCNYVHPDDLDKVTKIMTGLSQSGKPVISEMRIITRIGEVRTLTTTFSYESGDSSEDGIPSIYSVGIDITELCTERDKQREALIEAYQAVQVANQAKTEFLSRMSHDIRTPMNAILGMAALTESNLENTEKAADYLRKIRISGKYLMTLINEVLDMSKIESGSVELVQAGFSLSDLVQNLLDICLPMLQEKNQHLHSHIQKEIDENLSGDTEKLQQVLVNIFSNASKYTPDDGNISLTIRERRLNTPNARLFEFIIEDDGIGISEDFLTHIFDPFSRAEDSRTSKIQGTGLGMAISRTIIQMMGGSITVESKLNKGSRFTVAVPLRLQDNEEAPLTAMAGQRVLMVGINQADCQNVCILLNSLGIKSRWALNAWDALTEITHAHEAGEDYNIVIVDWQMPEWGGIETVAQIQSCLGSASPLFIAAAYDYTEISEDMLIAGIQFFISKPIFRSKLVQLFKKLADTSVYRADTIRNGNDFNGVRLLLVEDNDLNLEIAQELLLMKGFLVDTACNGKEATEKFSESEFYYYQLILMDLQMPVMNGYDASIHIRRLNRPDALSVPIIALTANAFSDDVRAGVKAGMNDHMTKPIDAKKMYAVIDKWLHHPADTQGTGE